MRRTIRFVAHCDMAGCDLFLVSVDFGHRLGDMELCTYNSCYNQPILFICKKDPHFTTSTERPQRAIIQPEYLKKAYPLNGLKCRESQQSKHQS